MTTLTEVTDNAIVKERFPPARRRPRGSVASPQIRNQGTLGGNVSQDARCWYYRAGWPCYRAGGNICYADTPTAVNREHAIFDADRCVAVNPSDTAPALIALDAQMVIATRRASASSRPRDFFIGPGTDITRMTMLQPGDLLTAIRIPATWAGKPYYFEKVRDRQVWDFALVNIASALNDVGLDHRRRAHRRQRRRGAAVCGSRTVEAAIRGQGARRGHGDAGRGDRRAGRGAAASQRLQDSADARPREARDSRRG